MRTTAKRRGLAHWSAEAVRAGIAARAAIARADDKIAARRREALSENGDGLALPDLVPMTTAERIEALQIALTWIQRAEEHTRRMRVLTERLLERLMREEL